MRLLQSIANLLLLIIALAGCGIQIERVEDEPRRGPGGSIFVGGLDGGIFVQLAAKEVQGGIYYGTLYEENGQIIYRGDLVHNTPEASFDPSLQDSYNAWSGERLYMKDNSYLTPRHGDELD